VLTAKAVVRNGTSLRIRAGLRLLSYDLLKHLLVEREVGDELFELAVLLLELAHLAQLAHAHTGVLGLPSVEGLL
jgi:hypothetical protein